MRSGSISAFQLSAFSVSAFQLFRSCVRFKSLEDLALDVVGRTVARVPAEEHMANFRAARALLGKEKKAKPKK